ncbi:hypothetical protein [uncultured Cetobacterium sp.]|uniref:hypothetical protein n=1 Tax=uncultured Cetobacterium sp. TaxID=527638 RepID=UPI002621095D|nr:hypothetical protein [uncultured Cetobacterium sp.]
MENKLIVIDYCDSFFPNYFLEFLKDLKKIKIKKTYISIKPDYQLKTTKNIKIIYIKKIQINPEIDKFLEEVLRKICEIADKHNISLRVSINKFEYIYKKLNFSFLQNSNYFSNDMFRFQKNHIIMTNSLKKNKINWNILVKTITEYQNK